MKRLYVVVFLFFIPITTFADISFDENGKWETSFDYSETCYNYYESISPSCTTIANDGIDYAYGGRETVSGIVSPSSVTTLANNPDGAGGMGSRHMVGDGNNSVSYKSCIFFSAEQELWLRFYIRYQEGFRWESFGYEKMFYIRTASGGDVIVGFGSGGYFYIVPANDQSNLVQGTYTWSDEMGGNSSHGDFFPIEIYLKMDTNGTNGIGRLWVNGDLKAEKTDVNWSGGNATARLGWNWFSFHENQSSPGNASGTIGESSAYVDYDDLVIYNTTPPNTDDDGNPYIGPISETPTTTTITGLEIR